MYEKVGLTCLYDVILSSKIESMWILVSSLAILSEWIYFEINSGYQLQI